AAGMPRARDRGVAELQPLPRAALWNAEFGLPFLPSETALQRPEAGDLATGNAADGPVPALLAAQEFGPRTQRQAVPPRRQQQRLAQVADLGFATDEMDVRRARAAGAPRRLEVGEHPRRAGVAPVEAELAGILFEAAVVQRRQRLAGLLQAREPVRIGLPPAPVAEHAVEPARDLGLGHAVALLQPGVDGVQRFRRPRPLEHPQEADRKSVV